MDRTVARRPVVAPPVRPVPAPSPSQSWDWERSHGLRNALVALAAVLLVGFLVAAFVVLRNNDGERTAPVGPAPTSVPGGGTAPVIEPGNAGPTTIPSDTPVTVPAAPPTTAAATAAPVIAPPTTATPAAAPTTRRPAAPTVTASPPYTCGPVPSTAPITTKPCAR